MLEPARVPQPHGDCDGLRRTGARAPRHACADVASVCAGIAEGISLRVLLYAHSPLSNAPSQGQPSFNPFANRAYEQCRRRPRGVGLVRDCDCKYTHFKREDNHDKDYVYDTGDRKWLKTDEKGCIKSCLEDSGCTGFSFYERGDWQGKTCKLLYFLPFHYGRSARNIIISTYSKVNAGERC